MRILKAVPASLAATLLVTCAAPQKAPVLNAPVSSAELPENAQTRPDVTGNVPRVAASDGLWRASDHRSALAARSCPPGTRFQEPLPIDLKVSPVSLGTDTQIARRIPETAQLSGAWELSSSNSNFGGLSGLALLPDGGLLAVTDAGAFVWIGLENGAPASAKLAYMQGSDGDMLTGKTEGDAEGLVWSDGLALVSFERRFRIEAFALETCGAAARAAQVATLPDQHNGRNIDENQGPEAIFLAPDGALGFGYEGMLSISPLGKVLADGTADWAGENAPAPTFHGLVGREIVALPNETSRTIELFRAWDPIQGNRIRLEWGDSEDEHLTLARPLLVDNFEGIAAEMLENGQLRVWIVSDNNFSGDQRTLLYAFDIQISQN